jgi:uncharacterized membrane protein
MFVLIGVALVIIGFALRLNPLLVVTVSGIITALIGQMSPLAILEAFGNGFASSRSVTTFVIILPVIGLIERMGLQQQAKRLINKLAALTASRILLGYLLFRQVTAAVGLLNIGGTPQMVRPLIYPMVEGAAEAKHGPLSERSKDLLKGSAAGTDNVGAFFAEDVFVAVGSILLITTFVDTAYGLKLQPLELALWAIPTAVVAFVLHGFRMLRLDARLDRAVAAEQKVTAA